MCYHVRIVYNYSLGISHAYVQSYIALTPSEQLYTMPLRYQMHSFCVGFYALSVSIKLHVLHKVIIIRVIILLITCMG